jgi:hypothetical protein
MAKSKKAPISILEAVDNLSHLAEKPEGEKNQETIRQTFSAINSYLHHIYYKERSELKHSQTQKGLQAMMQLAKEAATKYTDLFTEAHAKEEALPEYQQLQQFYLSKVFSQVKKEKTEEGWESEGLEPELYAERQALKDLETVQHDREYELFYIAREDGTPFFSSNLLRHIRMVGNFDETQLEEGVENLFDKIDVILDRDLHVAAQEILHDGADLIARFFKEALAHKERQEISWLSAAVMALMLGANPKNLRHNTTGKSSIDYFEDFEVYVRKVADSEAYGHWRQEKGAPFKTICLKLTHLLCSAFFLRAGARHDAVGLVSKLVADQRVSGQSIGEWLTSGEQLVRQELRRFPSGPLLKTVSLFRKEGEKIGFDPLMQQNFPSQIFTISSEALHTSVIHLPCPVHQDFIEKATIVPEFKGYLRQLTGQRHLYVNLQDRTSWKEHARAEAVEALSRDEEFSEQLCTITLAKGTDFYHQSEEYLKVDQADIFCSLFSQQILSGTESGFYFPPESVTPELISSLMTFVHRDIFSEKESLNRKERLDFIEIFYFFLVLRILEIKQADVMSFSCKDGVDTGAAMSAVFYGFSRMLSSSAPWSEEDKHFFLYAFFTPALFVRHRSIVPSIFQRAVSALDCFEQAIQAERHKILKSCARLFPHLPLENIKVSETA